MRRALSGMAVLVFVFASAARGLAQTSDFADTYQKAQTAYYENRYDEAITLLDSLLQDRPDNGPLLYNLGNAYFLKGDLPRARVAYERALALIPRFADLQANVAVLQNQLALPSDLTVGAEVQRAAFFWTNWLTLAELQWATLVVIFSVCSFWAYPLWKRRFRFGWRHVGSVLMSLYLALATAWLADERRPGHYAIVLVSDIPLKMSYLQQSAVTATLKAGERVEILDTQDFSPEERWLRLRLSDGRSGWALRSDFGII